MNHTRLSIAAHGKFPGDLLDGAIPTGDDAILVASGMTDFGTALMAAERDNSEALLLFTPGVDEVREVLSNSRAARPEMALVVAMPGPVNGEISEALRAGAHEIVVLPAEAAVVGASVRTAMARVTHEAEVETAVAIGEAPMVVVLGPKGGVGKTTVSTNVAAVLAEQGRRVLLIDLDLQFGDVGVVYGLEPERTIYDLAVAPGKLDGERLRSFVTTSVDNVHTLLAPVRPDQAEALTSERVEAILQVARAEYDVVVVDTPPAFNNTTIIAIDQANFVVMIGTLDLPGLKNLKVGLQTLDLMGVSRERTLVVLNRSDAKVGLIPSDVKRVLQRAPEVSVPSDRSVPKSLNSGRPLVAVEPRSAPAKALRELSNRVAEALQLTKDA